MTLLLALALAWAPVLPSFAMMSAGGDAEAVHAHHDAGPAHAPESVPPEQAPCTQHDSCNGQCCDICAQCFHVLSLVMPYLTHSRPVLTPVTTSLHPRLLATSPDRPPRLSV